MDPWLINPMFGQCTEVNPADAAGLDCVQSNVDALLTKVRRKYKEYGINEKPFVVVKADTGSDSLGPITVRDAKDLGDAYARARSRAAATAGDVPLAEATQVIIQEGVPTYERVNDAVAEPVVTMIDRYVVGGYYRVHAERGVDENLNAPGARYVPLAFAGSHHLPRPGEKPGANAPNRFYMYGVIGRLAMLAASYELEATDPDAEVYE
jgi:glutamate--cysteine ligase